MRVTRLALIPAVVAVAVLAVVVALGADDRSSRVPMPHGARFAWSSSEPVASMQDTSTSAERHRKRRGSATPSGRAQTEIVSDGEDATSMDHPDVSADGRYIVFTSFARNLSSPPPACGALPYCETLYLRDRVEKTTSVIYSQSTDTMPETGDHVLAFPSISGNGRFIGFSTYTWLSPFFFRGAPGDGTAFNAFNAYLYDRETGQTDLVSRNSAGDAAMPDPLYNGDLQYAPLATGSFATSISNDGRFVTFTSDGGNLPGSRGAGHAFNVYRRDRQLGTTVLVSTDEQGRPLQSDAFACTGRNISGDGRYVAFENLVRQRTYAMDHLEDYEVRLWDATTGRSRIVSLPPGTEQRGTHCPTMSSDGSKLGVISNNALVPGDTNAAADTYEYDIATQTFRRASVTSTGGPVTGTAVADPSKNGIMPTATISGDGRYMVFDAQSSELDPNPASPLDRVYVHDFVTGTTTLVSVTNDGTPFGGATGSPYISADGGTIVFMTTGVDPEGKRRDVVVRTASG